MGHLTCPYCSKMYSSYSGLWKHKKKYHSDSQEKGSDDPIYFHSKYFDLAQILVDSLGVREAYFKLGDIVEYANSGNKLNWLRDEVIFQKYKLPIEVRLNEMDKEVVYTKIGPDQEVADSPRDLFQLNKQVNSIMMMAVPKIWSLYNTPLIEANHVLNAEKDFYPSDDLPRVEKETNDYLNQIYEGNRNYPLLALKYAKITPSFQHYRSMVEYFKSCKTKNENQT